MTVKVFHKSGESITVPDHKLEEMQRKGWRLNPPKPSQPKKVAKKVPVTPAKED